MYCTISLSNYIDIVLPTLGHLLKTITMSTVTAEPVMPGSSDDRTHPTEDILNALSALNSSTTPTVPPKTDSEEPPSEYDLLNKQVRDNPHDHDAWRRLVDVAEATGDIEKISPVYDALLKQFPNTVCLPPVDTPLDLSEPFFLFSTPVSRPKLRFNTSAISPPMSLPLKVLNSCSTNSLRVLHASNSGVFTCLSFGTALSLLILFHSPPPDRKYLRRLNAAPSQREIVRKSYEFALNHIGQDKESGPIWQDYIQLIKSGEVSIQTCIFPIP